MPVNCAECCVAILLHVQQAIVLPTIICLCWVSYKPDCQVIVLLNGLGGTVSGNGVPYLECCRYFSPLTQHCEVSVDRRDRRMLSDNDAYWA